MLCHHAQLAKAFRHCNHRLWFLQCDLLLKFLTRKQSTLMKPEESPGVCETLLPDVVVHEVHHNDHSYVRELSRSTFSSLRKNLAWWAVTQKTTKLSKLKGGCLPGTIW